MWLWSGFGRLVKEPPCLGPNRVSPRRLWTLDLRLWTPGFPHKPPDFNSSRAPPSVWSGGTLDKPWTCPGTMEPAQTLIFDQPHLSSSLRPTLHRLHSARADGVFPATPRCSPHVYPMWITKSPLFAGFSHYFLHPARFVLPSLRRRAESNTAARSEDPAGRGGAGCAASLPGRYRNTGNGSSERLDGRLKR